MSNKKTILMVFMLTLSTLFPYLATQSRVGLSSSETKIHVKPVVSGPPYRVPVCDDFAVNILITEVQDLWYYNFTLTYDTAKLNVLEVSDDLFFPEPKDTKKSWDENRGELYIRVVALGGSRSCNHTDALVTTRFKSTGEIGRSDLVLEDVVLLDDGKKEIDCEKTKARIEIVITHPKPIVIDDASPRYYPICYDMMFSGDAIKIHSSNVTVDLKNHTIMALAGGNCIYIAGEENVTIKNGRIDGFQVAIKTDEDCYNININNVNIFNHSHIGIHLRDSDNVTITDTDISGTETSEEGIHIWYSCNVTIKNSKISKSGDGILVEGQKHPKKPAAFISGNTIEHNSQTGVKIKNDSNGSTIENNTIYKNENGIVLSAQSAENKIYHNNLIENTEQASDEGDNEWNLPYPYCGNYWDDHDCVDHCCGVSVPQIIVGSDGIADTSYLIDPNVEDEYPLIDPYGSTYRVENVSYRKEKHPLAIYSNSSITLGNLDDFGDKPAQIDFTVSSTDTPWFCTIIIWSTLMDGAFRVSIDNFTIPVILMWEEPKIYTLIHFTYSHGDYNVQIVGEVPFDVNGDGRLDINDIVWLADQIYR